MSIIRLVRKPIGIGSNVRLKPHLLARGAYRQVTVVRGFLPDIAGGVVLADALDQSRCWNVEHLQHVRFDRSLRRGRKRPR